MARAVLKKLYGLKPHDARTLGLKGNRRSKGRQKAAARRGGVEHVPSGLAFLIGHAPDPKSLCAPSTRCNTAA